MTVNPSIANQLAIRMKGEAPAGSCFTTDQIQQLFNQGYVEVPTNLPDSSNASLQISSQLNNLAQLDAEQDLFVSAVVAFEDSKTALASTHPELVFSGWPSLVDPTSRYTSFSYWVIYSSTEAGVKAKDEAGSGTVTIRPSLEITSVTATQIKCKVFNNASD